MERLSGLLEGINGTVFTELKFWLLVLFSLVVPFAIYIGLLVKRALSRKTILLLGFAMVGIAGLDVYLLQSLATMARNSVSMADDTIFASEVSLALYLLPVMFGGIGINIVSSVLANHLEGAQRRFKAEQEKAVSDADTR